MNHLPMGVVKAQEPSYNGIQAGLIESLVEDGMVVYGVDSKGIGANVYNVYVCAPNNMPDKTAWVRNLDSHEVAALFVALAPRASFFESAKQIVAANLPGVNS